MITPLIIQGRLFCVNNSTVKVYNIETNEWETPDAWSFLGSPPSGAPFSAGGSGHRIANWNGHILAGKSDGLRYFDFSDNSWNTLTLPSGAIASSLGTSGDYIVVIKGDATAGQECLYYSDDGINWSLGALTRDTGAGGFVDVMFIDAYADFFVAEPLSHPGGGTSAIWKWDIVNDIYTVMNPNPFNAGQVRCRKGGVGFFNQTIHNGVLYITAEGHKEDTTSDITITIVTTSSSTTFRVTIYGIVSEVVGHVSDASITAANLKSQLDTNVPEIGWQVTGNVITATIPYRLITSQFASAISVTKIGGTGTITLGNVTSNSATLALYKYNDSEFEFAGDGPGVTVIASFGSFGNDLLVGTDSADASLAPPNNFYKLSEEELINSGIAETGTNATTAEVTQIIPIGDVIY